MASIRKEILIDAPAELVWDAVRDVGAVHKRQAPGLVVDTRLEGDARIVTFACGLGCIDFARGDLGRFGPHKDGKIYPPPAAHRAWHCSSSRSSAPPRRRTMRLSTTASGVACAG